MRILSYLFIIEFKLINCGQRTRSISWNVLTLTLRPSLVNFCNCFTGLDKEPIFYSCEVYCFYMYTRSCLLIVLYKSLSLLIFVCLIYYLEKYAKTYHYNSEVLNFQSRQFYFIYFLTVLSDTRLKSFNSR